MSTLTNKIDFALVFSVKNANPNGDPLGGNRPRTTSEGLGEVSDVCLKRKIRNRLQIEGYDIFVQSSDNTADNMKSLSERYNAFVRTLPEKDINNRDVLARKLCEKWLDVRAFGQVFAYKEKKNKENDEDIDKVSLGVRGPVTIQSAFSLEPITIESIQITKSVNSETTTDGKKSSDTMGMKHRVNKAIYVTYGSISPQLAEKSGFSLEDAEAIKKALITLFENDESSARPSGSMEVVNVVWWIHRNKSGQFSSAKVHKSIAVKLDGTIEIVDQLTDLTPEIY